MTMARSLLSLTCTFLIVAVHTVYPSMTGGQETSVARPKAVDLLPERTVVYVQVDDIRKMFEEFGQTGFGQMLQDERVAPLVNDLWGEAKAAYEDVQEQVGVSFEELEALPQGEICFAVVAPRRADPSFAFIMDVNEDAQTAESLLARGRELAESDGGRISSEEIEGLEVQLVGEPDGDFEIRYLLHEGTFIAATTAELMSEMLVRWMGTPPEDDRSLKDNRKFVTVMNKCRSSQDLPMSLAFYMDPMELVRSSTRGNFGAQAMLAALPILGLDGLLGVGGASLFNEQGYESIFHMHVLLANPRAGILEMIALKPGQYEPEPWVPDDVSTYMTSNWDVNKAVAELEKIINTFMGDDAFNTQIDQNINSELGIDFREDLLGNLGGRLTYMQWIEPPARFNSQVNAGSIQIRDVDKFKDLLNILLERVNEDEENIVQATYEGVDFWQTAEEINPNSPPRQFDSEGNELPVEDQISVDMRSMRPSFVILGDSFVVTESTKFLERVIDTYKGDERALADDEQFRDATREMTRLLGTQMPAVTMYSRPDLAFRLWFEMAQTENTRDLLAMGAEENKYVRGLQRVIEENPLPDFDDVKHYFAPSGAFITNDETGFHLLAFQIKAGQ